MMITYTRSNQYWCHYHCWFQCVHGKGNREYRIRRERLRKGTEALLANSSKGLYYLAEADGKIVGQLLITYEWSDWRNATFWWIQSVYVHPEYVVKEYSDRCTAPIETIARKRGDVCGLRLYVDTSNKRAQQTYEALGIETFALPDDGCRFGIKIGIIHRAFYSSTVFLHSDSFPCRTIFYYSKSAEPILWNECLHIDTVHILFSNKKEKEHEDWHSRNWNGRSAIGTKCTQLGHDVKMGSRTATNEKAAAWVQKNGKQASQGTFTDAAAFGEIVLIVHTASTH